MSMNMFIYLLTFRNVSGMCLQSEDGKIFSRKLVTACSRFLQIDTLDILTSGRAEHKPENHF
jgi:hypothetical protein